MKIVAGVDEVGRGSLVGPVFAAAVILNNGIDVVCAGLDGLECIGVWGERHVWRDGNFVGDALE